jgi:hypothetical protein
MSHEQLILFIQLFVRQNKKHLNVESNYEEELFRKCKHDLRGAAVFHLQ